MIKSELFLYFIQLQLLFSILQGWGKFFNIRTAVFSGFRGNVLYFQNVKCPACYFGPGPFPGYFTYLGLAFNESDSKFVPNLSVSSVLKYRRIHL
ncbi:hypothetical protein HMPREF3213_03845 [Heyndrickxia coagulans]|jgi:hypothetical protein|uniref:Uncharacterized protein n=1 Tax=Heyndrickxia coagulans TaxID=1398 RepID=A0A133KA59_HEYCO|nr:hypothetical protein HMPREF3213_03845 [Heyndrickxia coagulans]